MGGGGGGWGADGGGGTMASGMAAIEAEREETRNLHDHVGDMSNAQGGGGNQPFMRSLTSMHHSPTNVEAHYAAKKRQEWLSELGAQVRTRQEARHAERLEKEMTEMRESMAERQMRESADAQLRAELAQRGGKKAPPPS